MYQEEYIRDLGSNYLVLSEEAKEYDEFQVKMLMNNRIAGLLECELRMIDGQEKFLYEISSRQPISRIYERTKMSYDTLISILRGIARAVESAKEYLLDTRHFILKPEYMYMNPETKKMSLCFFPLYQMESEQAFHQLAAYVLDKIDYHDERAVVLAYDFYRKAKEDNFNIRTVLDRPISVGKHPVSGQEGLQQGATQQNAIQEKIVQQGKAYQEDFSQEVADRKQFNEKALFTIGMVILILLIIFLLWIQLYQPVFLLQSRDMQRLVLVIMGSMGGIAAFIGFVIANRIYRRRNQSRILEAEETILRRYHAEETMQRVMSKEAPYCGETTLLTQSEQKMIPKLVHMKDGKLQEIRIQHTPFMIGKMGRGIDAVLKDRSISRMHAEISEQDGHYFLTDLNSTNGTYKNGVRLNANETTAIVGDDEIKFAELTFYFACC